MIQSIMADRQQRSSATWGTPGVGRLIALPRAVADLKPLHAALHFKPAPRSPGVGPAPFAQTARASEPL